MVHKTRVLRGTSNPQWREDFMVRRPGGKGPWGGDQGGGDQGEGTRVRGPGWRGPGWRIELVNVTVLCVENKDYSATCFSYIAAFKAPYVISLNFIKGRADMCFINLLDIHASTRHV